MWIAGAQVIALDVSWVLQSSDNLQWEMLRLQVLTQLRQINMFSSEADFHEWNFIPGAAWVFWRTSWLLLANLCHSLCLFRWSVVLSYRKEDVVIILKDRFCPSGLSQTEPLKGIRDWTRNTSVLLQEGEAVNYHWKWPGLSSNLSYGSLLSAQTYIVRHTDIKWIICVVT